MIRILTCDSLVVKCLAFSNQQPAVSHNYPYEGAIITLIICVSLIIITCKICSYYVAKLNKKNNTAPIQNDKEKTRLYISLIEKKLDFEEKLTNSKFAAEVNKDNVKSYQDSLKEQIEAFKPNANEK